MAGHSQYANIKHRKNAQDAKRAKIFTKLVREVSVAAASGLPDPTANPRLRHALAAARKAGVPKDRLHSAVQKASGEGGGVGYENVRYEGYATGGVPVIVEALTDNRNRTASEVRSAFNKHGGNLGETGSVSFLFDKLGFIVYSNSVASEDKAFEAAIEAGADDVKAEDGSYTIICSADSFGDVREALEETLGESESSDLIWAPQNPMELGADQRESVEKLLDALEDCDDVQNVYAAAII